MPSGALLAVRGLAYLYEQTGVETYRDIARTAFFAAQWILVSPESVHSATALVANNVRSARELAQFTRSSNAMVYWLRHWADERSRSGPAASAERGGRPFR